MTKITSYTLGRHKDCDIHFNSSTVSRVHAEIIFCEDGRFYLTDCMSTGGSFVQRDGAWQPVRQEFVAPNERLKFGDYEIQASELKSLAPAANRSSSPSSESSTSDQGLRRDPNTGEIIQ
jgi:pSer/pThr/pTyr-binding forkhead associated (FHA) protein